MALSNQLLSEFAKITNDNNKKTENTTAYGEVIRVGSDSFVKIDGSELLTPFQRTVTVKEGDRVRLKVENHSVTVTGNLSDPSYSSSEGEAAHGKIEEFDIIISHKVTTDEIYAIEGYFEHLQAIIAEIEDLQAVYAHIEELKATYINADHLNANDIKAINAEIERLKTQILESEHITTDQIDACYGYFNNIEAYNAKFVYVSAEILEAMKASIEELDVEHLDAKYAQIDFANIGEAAINKLKAHFADIDFANIDVAAINNLTAKMVNIDFATINQATIESLEAKYADIDFSNIGIAAIKKLFADSGIIKDIIVEQGKITGELVGVTIKGDLIEAGTLRADKLVVLGEDGLYYKLNIDGLDNISTSQANKFVVLDTEPDDWSTNYTDYYLIDNNAYKHIVGEEAPTFVANTYYKLSAVHGSGLDGTNIIAQTITADKINVSDLVAFDATIGGFDIDAHAIHSHTKTSATSTVRGLYMNDSGEFAIGDMNHFMRYYHDTTTDTYKLEIQADNIKMGTGNKDLQETLDDMQDKIDASKKEIATNIASIVIQYAKGDSSTDAPTTGWSENTPQWEQGKFIWTKQIVTLNNGTVNTSKPVCITGNTGAQGEPGKTGASSYTYVRYSANPDGTDFTSNPSSTTEYIGIYTGVVSTAPTDKNAYTWSKYKGDPGPQGNPGQQGNPGSDGNGINSISYFYAATSTQIAPSASSITSTTIPTMSSSNKYLWQKQVIDFTDTGVPDKTIVALIGVYGDQGQQGNPGQAGTSVTIISKSVDYTTSTSGTSIPSSGWKSTIPSVTLGHFLWTRTIVSYSDGNSTTSYSVAHAGTNGVDGDDGLGIKTITEQYYLSTSKTSCTGGSWSTTMPTWEENKYIWMRMKIEWTYDGSTVAKTTYTSPFLAEAINLSHENIAEINSKINKWIKSVTTYYATSDSNDYIGNDVVWSTTKPTGISGKAIWVKNKIVYSDDTESETMPICQFAFYPSGSTPSVSMTTQSETGYNFEKNGEWYQNTNQKQDSTTCQSIFNVTNNTSGTKRVEVVYQQDGEVGFDYLIINGSTTQSNNSGSKIFSVNSNTTVSWTIQYKKDGSASKNTDTGKFKFLYAPDTLNNVYNQYYVSSSITGLTNGSWIDSFPNMDNKDKYLWKRERFVWSNGDVTYGNAYLIGPCYVNVSYVVNELERTLNSTFGTTQNGWEMMFNVLTSNINNINKYIRFENGNIVLGEEGNAVTLKLENDVIAFYQFGQRVAYFSDGELKVSQASITTQLNLGNFEFVPGKNGNLTFRKKG